MELFKLHRYLVLLLFILCCAAVLEQGIWAEATRPLPLLPKQSYSKIFASLGVVCKCCDGEESSSCTTTSLDGSCSYKLYCQSWKFD
ncbi:hypothetical protein ABFS82_10G025500 [Erythranthe guttata]